MLVPRSMAVPRRRRGPTGRAAGLVALLVAVLSGACLMVDVSPVFAAPTPPQVTSPANGSTDNVGYTIFRGHSFPGYGIVVSEGGKVICQTTVVSDASWACIAYQPLANGQHTVSVVAVDASGASSMPTTVRFIEADTTPVAPVISVPAAGAVVSDATPTFSGTGVAGDTVTVTDFQTSGAGTFVCSGVVARSGAWSCSPSSAMAQSEHAVAATQTGPTGTSIWTSLRRFWIILPSPATTAPTTQAPPKQSASAAPASSTKAASPTKAATATSANSAGSFTTSSNAASNNTGSAKTGSTAAANNAGSIPAK